MKTIEEMFWQRVIKTDGCWKWVGRLNRQGRAQMKIGRKFTNAARISHELFIGPLPRHLYALHTCDNPNCVNPKHIYAGTQLDNMRDMVSRGRSLHRKGYTSPCHKVTPEMLAEIRKRHVRWCPVNGTTALAKEFNVSVSLVQNIANGRVWAEGVSCG